MDKIDILKVGSKSNPNSVAGAIACAIRENNKVEIQTIGAGACNQAVKSIAIARGYLISSGIDLLCAPSFSNIFVEGENRTGIKFVVEKRIL